jgi:hypothetical protein
MFSLIYSYFDDWDRILRDGKHQGIIGIVIVSRKCRNNTIVTLLMMSSGDPN